MSADYGGIVTTANSTGLLPIWNKYVDNAQVKAKGFGYNIAKAKSILKAAGYKDNNDDGFVENKDGSKIDLEPHRPERLVGLDDGDPDHLRQREGRGHQDHAAYPDYNTLVDTRGHAATSTS